MQIKASHGKTSCERPHVLPHEVSAFIYIYIYIYILINNDIHKSKAPCTPGVYMERITSRSKIAMIKHNKKIRAKKRSEN